MLFFYFYYYGIRLKNVLEVHVIYRLKNRIKSHFTFCLYRSSVFFLDKFAFELNCDTDIKATDKNTYFKIK